MTLELKAKLSEEFASIINRYSVENESNTPDFILSAFLVDCLEAHIKLTRRRDSWYGGKQSILDSDKNEKWAE